MRFGWQMSVLAALLACLLMGGGCAKLPDNYGRPTSFAIGVDETSTLYRRAAEILGPDQEESAYFLLGSGLDAFVARAALAHFAEKSIDAQYYLLHDDVVGRLFIDQLLKAADRGVRVRLLVDDMGMAGRDVSTAVVDAHPNIEVRLFNPFGRNTGRFFQYLTGFGQQTRRAHNKSFTVDSIATIVGGRNIGDEYFVADPAMAFIDLDVLAVGPVAALVGGSFDLYWNHELSYPISSLVKTLPTEEQKRQQMADFNQFIEEQRHTVYYKELSRSKFSRALQGYRTELVRGRGKGQVVWDHPDKLASSPGEADLMIDDLMPHLDKTSKELFIVSPYFIPGVNGLEFFKRLRDRGIRVVVLTNSLASTDVSIVHAGYANYRRRLLRMGVELYELNRNLSDEGHEDKNWKFYESIASLHAKCFVIDRHTAVIGSLNLDPRSVIQNTEIGIVIESEKIADRIVTFLENEMDRIAFRLELKSGHGDSDYIVWHGLVGQSPQSLYAEPYTSIWKRFVVNLMRLLPIESQL